MRVGVRLGRRTESGLFVPLTGLWIPNPPGVQRPEPRNVFGGQQRGWPVGVPGRDPFWRWPSVVSPLGIGTSLELASDVTDRGDGQGDSTSFSTPSLTIPDGHLGVALNAQFDGGSDPGITTVSGHGTWTAIDDLTFDDGSIYTNISGHYFLPTSGDSTAAVSFTQDGSGGAGIVLSVSEVPTTGTPAGADAIRNFDTTDGGQSTTVTGTLPAFGGAGNICIQAVAVADLSGTGDIDLTTEESYDEYDTGTDVVEGFMRLTAGSLQDEDTSPRGSTSGTHDIGQICFEVVNDGAAGSLMPRGGNQRRYYQRRRWT